MNIGIITYGYPPEKIGGAEIQAKILAKKLSARNHMITVFTGSRDDEIINEKSNLKIVKIKYKDKKILRIFFSQLISFLPKIKEFSSKIDVLLCYQVNPPGIIGLVCKLKLKIPLVTCLRAETEYTSFLRKFIFTPLLLKYSDQFVVQTSIIKKDLSNLFFYRLIFNREMLKNIRIISNGIDISYSQENNPAQRSGVLYVGRLHKLKGVKYLLKAMKGIKSKLLIIGEGQEKKNLKKMSEELNLDIEFLGELPQSIVFKYMKRARLLVLPSLGEAMPNVILEAMNLGLPVIATYVGSLTDIIKHGKTGFLAEPKNPEQIQKYIEILLNNDDLWRKISKNCIREVKKYSWNNVIEKYEEILGKAVR